MPDLGPLAKIVLDVAGPAIRVMLKTTIGSLVLTTFVCVFAFHLASNRSTSHGLGALLLTVLVGLVATGFIATKQAVTRALVTALRRFALGSKMSHVLFERILQVHAEDPHGERGRAVAEQVERIPLADAERLLQKGTTAILGGFASQGGFRGWLGRQLNTRAMGLIANVTLGRFRDEAQQHGGVDLVQVRDWVAETVDEKAAEAVEGAALRITVLVAVGASLLCLGVSYGIGHHTS